MAAWSSQHVQRIQPKEEVDENFLDVDAVVFDGHQYSTRRELEARLSVGETYTANTRPQLRSNDLVAMADNHSRISHVEAWINQELFGDVMGASEQQHQDERELYITTLRKDVDEYIEMFDYMRSNTDMSAVCYGVGEEQYHTQSQGTDDLYLSPVDSEYRGMYYDEPQLWCFS
ncbi:hypothetical protein M758_5G061900 [Ceratodon purpureus]|nr:hypothetical protein M758_5G061900 [Ceratodon purpureus]